MIVLLSAGLNIARESLTKSTKPLVVAVFLSQITGRSDGVVLHCSTILSPTTKKFLLLGKVTPWTSIKIIFS